MNFFFGRDIEIIITLLKIIVVTSSIRARVVDIPDGNPKWDELNEQSDLIEDSPSELKMALKKKKEKEKEKKRKREEEEDEGEEENRGEEE